MNKEMVVGNGYHSGMRPLDHVLKTTNKQSGRTVPLTTGEKI